MSNKWLIIGSTAMKHWYPEWRTPKDIDLLTPAKLTSSDSTLCAVDTHWHEYADELISLNSCSTFADPNILLTLKLSHAHWNIKWAKHVLDIDYLRQKGAIVHEAVYEKLVSFWPSVHGKKHVNLNQEVTAFFSDAVVRIHDHEYLHKIVAFNGTPMHERIRPDLASAWVDRRLFERLSREEQLQCVLEEMLVTAIERGRLTVTSLNSERLAAVSFALKQLATSMTHGWFSRFIIENHRELFQHKRATWQQQLTKALLILS